MNNLTAAVWKSVDGYESEDNMPVIQGNLANSYAKLGPPMRPCPCERAMIPKLYGEEHKDSIVDAFNYASTFSSYVSKKSSRCCARRFPWRYAFSGRTMKSLTLQWNYGELCEDPGSTLDDLREAVTTLEDAERIARRVFGRAHPTTARMGGHLRYARAALRARETAETISLLVFVVQRHHPDGRRVHQKCRARRSRPCLRRPRARRRTRARARGSPGAQQPGLGAPRVARDGVEVRRRVLEERRVERAQRP